MAFLAAIGSVLGAGSSVAQGNAAKAAGEYNGRLNDQNARISGERTMSDVAAMRREQARVLGSIRASYGANGVTPDGSPTDVLDNSLIDSELDILNREYSGELEAMGFRSSAKLDRMGGNSAAAAAQARAASTLIGEAAEQYKKRGNPVRVNRAPPSNNKVG